LSGQSGVCPFLEALKSVLKKKEKFLSGVRVSACPHVTTETASWMEVFQARSVDVVLCASNPLSTQGDVAASLVKNSKIPVFAIQELLQ
jgi:adenosylhomocysteinase